MDDKLINKAFQFCLDWLETENTQTKSKAVLERLNVLGEAVAIEEQNICHELNVESLDLITQEQDIDELNQAQKNNSFAALLSLTDAITELEREINSLDSLLVDQEIQGLKRINTELVALHEQHNELRFRQVDLDLELENLRTNLEKYEETDSEGNLIIDHDDPRNLWRTRQSALEIAAELQRYNNIETPP